jgi:LacI family transcriptional regulator
MKRIGIRDVAAAAGVSVTTVSHALSGQGHVAEETRERVRNAARELNYAPNQIASSLRRQRTRVVGLVSDQIATTPFAGRVVLGAQQAAAEHDLVLMVVDSAGEAAIEARQIEALHSYQVDGFLYAKMFHQIVSRPKLLAKKTVVFVDAEAMEPEHCVVPDEVEIGQVAAQHLIEAGHRRIGVLSIHEDTPAKTGRLEGVFQALDDASIARPPIAFGESTSVGGRIAALELLDRADRPTALLCFNDQMAMGAYQAASELGLRVPSDLSIIGVDDLRIVAEGVRPMLTTVALPHFEMGYWAITRLVALLDGSAPAPAVERLACQLISRDSVAAPAAQPIATA